jgi:uncharacterized protein
MSEPLPELLDLRRAVEAGAQYEGALPLAGMPRLLPMLMDAVGSARYRVRFAKDHRGLDAVEGEVDATLRVRCERCTGVLTLPVSTRFAVAVVQGLDEAAALPDDYEPLLVEVPQVRARDLIEDELILAVPIIPRHAEGECSPPAVAPGVLAPEGDEDAAEAPARNPFAVLARLKDAKQ